MAKPAAIVLCGGESRRMGQSKAWLDFGPEKLLQRVVRLASEAAQPIVVVAAAKQELPPLPAAVAIARDALPGRGPLEGLLAGLNALAGAAEFAYVTATDAPFLNPASIGLLGEIIGESDLAVPYVEGRHHPLAALYRVAAIRPLVEALLLADRLKMKDLIDVAKTRVVSAAELAAVDPGWDTLRNVNAWAEYHQALGDARWD